MIWKPPESDRPIDIDLSSIRSGEDADAATMWLENKIQGMRSQLAARALSGVADEGWVARVTTAIQKTQTTRLRLQNIRGRIRRLEKLNRQIRLEEAFMNSVLRNWEPDDIKEIWEDVYREHPELRRGNEWRIKEGPR